MIQQNPTDPENTIAFQGVPGAHSDLACRRSHPYMDTLPCPSFEDVFVAVEEGRATLGMLPIENSQAGRVAEMHNLLPETNLHFVGEYFHRVEHHLLGVKGAKLSDVKQVYSHPQALMQCRQHLQAIGKLERCPYADTAGAARDVAEWGDKSKAAIGSALASELYGLDILKENIEDSKENTTLFVAIAKEPLDLALPEPGIDDTRVLTTLIFQVRNIPSALYKALGGFATNGVNMIKLESYILPTNEHDTAQFFITFEGHPEARNVQHALDELGFFCRNVKILGVYPADPSRYIG